MTERKGGTVILGDLVIEMPGVSSRALLCALIAGNADRVMY